MSSPFKFCRRRLGVVPTINCTASPEHHSLSGFIAKTSSVVFCLPFSRIILCLQ
uniref:Uncharacterized protein n=1 Tax=Moniliophthora roreri TaxID=221103 RepID=A0A0W0G1B3_MONRR